MADLLTAGKVAQALDVSPKKIKDAIEKATRLGAKDYIVKPVTESKLIKAVEKVLAQ